MIFPGSRYEKTGQVLTTLPDGTQVMALKTPLPGAPLVQGYLRRRSDQRLDLIAAQFVRNPTAFWRLCDANNTLVPDALCNASLVGIPLPGK